jgi:hypothetical protein
MDLNLGEPGYVEIRPAKQVWELVHNKVDGTNIRFFGVSNRPETVSLAEQEGIPSKITHEFDLLEFLS